MRLKNGIIFFLAVMIIFSALLVNFIVVKSYTVVDIGFIDKISKVYLDIDKMPDSQKAEILSLTATGTPMIYKRLIENVSKPVSQFYGFAGYLKSSPSQAVNYIRSGILASPKKCIVVTSSGEYETYLGYAILLLIKDNPSWLQAKPGADFYAKTSDVIMSLYNNNPFPDINSYKSDVTALIRESYPDLKGGMKEDFLDKKEYSQFSKQEKMELVTMFPMLDDDKKYKFIKDMIKDSDNSIKSAALKEIDEKSPKELAQLIDTYVLSSVSQDTDLLNLGVDKYTLLLKSDSLVRLRRVVAQNLDNLDMIDHALDKYALYGNEIHYEFLTYFLGPRYPETMHNKALKVLIASVWNGAPDDVMRTLVYTVKKSGSSTAAVSIEFMIKNNLSGNHASVLNRLRQLENDDMKRLALKYIGHFLVKDGADIIETLKNDSDPDISAKAAELYDRL